MSMGDVANFGSGSTFLILTTSVNHVLGPTEQLIRRSA
jgi:hypothetical protein